MGTTSVTATDMVTDTQITTLRAPLTTRFDTDPVYTEGRDRVLP